MEEARAWSEVLPAYEDRGLEMVMISIDPNETEQSIEAFNAQAGVSDPLPTVVDGGDVAQEFGANALETTVILDRDHRVAAIFLTEVLDSELIPEVRKVAQESRQA